MQVMGAVALFLLLIPGGLLYSDHIDRKIAAGDLHTYNFVKNQNGVQVKNHTYSKILLDFPPFFSYNSIHE